MAEPPTTSGRFGLANSIVVKSATGSDRFYSTLTAAKNAAVSGETIIVGPGTYSERNLLKNGVNWYFHDGAKVLITTTTSSAGPFIPNGAAIFDDSALAANGAVTCIIDGLGEFKRTENGASVAEATIFIHNSSSNVTLRCKTVGGGGKIYYTLWQDGGRFSLHCLTLSTDSTGYNTVFWSNGEMFLDCEEITTAGTGAAIVANMTAGSGWSAGSMWITADRISASTNATQGIVVDGTTSARIWINTKKIETSSGPAVAINGGRVYITAEKIESSASFAISAQGGLLWLNAQKIETTGPDLGPIDVEGGTVNLQIQTLAGSAGDQLIYFGPGSGVIEIQEATTTGTTMLGLNFGSGTLRLLNTKIDALSASAANPVSVTASGLILQNCVLLAEAGRDSIYAGSAKTVKIYGTSVANKAKNANVTLQVGTLTVDTNVT